MKYLRAFAGQKKTLVVLVSVLGGIILLSAYPWAGAGSADAAAESEETGEPGAMAAPSMTAMSMKVIGSVALVIGLLYGAVYVMKRFGPGFGARGVRENAIAVVHKRHIAPKKAIYILKIGQRSMVVGVTDSQISHLADLTDEDVDSIKAEEKPKTSTFKQYLFGAEAAPKSRG